MIWQLIDQPCPRCGACSTCYRCGGAIACRFRSAGQVRVHVGQPPDSATYALTGLSDDTPDFPGEIEEYTVFIGGDP